MIRQYRRKGYWCSCTDYDRWDCLHIGQKVRNGCHATKREGERRHDDRGVSFRAGGAEGLKGYPRDRERRKGMIRPRNRRKRCPFPVGDDGGSAAICFERRHYGCQAGGNDWTPPLPTAANSPPAGHFQEAATDPRESAAPPKSTA